MDPSAYTLHAAIEERHWWFVARRRVLDATLASLGLPAGSRLLEFGSGTGGNLRMLTRFGSVVGVEPSAEARAIAAAACPQAEQLRDLAGLEGRPIFDAALALDVIEHLDDPVASLAQLRRWLAPGAPLVITVPAHPLLFGDHDRYLHHRRRYTPRLLREHIEAGGLGVERLGPLNAAALPAAAAARVIEGLRARVSPGGAPRPRGMDIPPTWLNRALTHLVGAERHLVGRGLVPFGLSLLAVARAPR